MSETVLPYREGQELLVKAKFKYFNESIQEAVLSIGADDCQQKVFVPIEKLSEIVQPEDSAQRYADGKCAEPNRITSPEPEWLPKINTVEYRNAVTPHLRHLLKLYHENDGIIMDDELRFFLDNVLIATHDAIDRLVPTVQSEALPTFGEYSEEARRHHGSPCHRYPEKDECDAHSCGSVMEAFDVGRHFQLGIQQALRAQSITASDVETWRKNTMRPDEVLGFAGEIPITGRFLLNALAELTDNA